MTTIAAHTPGTPGWFNLTSSDAAAARSFYGALFGWTFVLAGPELGHHATALLDERPAAGIGGTPPGVELPSAWSVFFIGPDADLAARQIADAGGAVVMGPVDIGEDGRMLLATDATGAAFGVWQPGGHVGARAVNEPGAMGWCEVNTRDATRAGAFYQAVFGLAPRPLAAPGMTYHTLHTSGVEAAVCGILQMDHHWPDTIPPHWMAYFEVADTDAACAQVTALGGKVCVPAFDSPYGRIAVVEDPQGATFSLLRPSRT